MKTQYPLFSQVALAEDLPEHHLKRGDIATVVEYYPMPDEEDDGIQPMEAVDDGDDEEEGGNAD